MTAENLAKKKVGDRVLIIRSPWVDLILKGKKTWELRSSPTKIRGTIQLAEAGKIQIVGRCELIDCRYVSKRELQRTKEKHQVPNVLLRVPYPRVYAWVFRKAVRYKRPKRYNHPNGAIIWVNANQARQR
eukprot:CAMPEP_0172721288 /NCGR_PEP_ID=MMETSP1074-20121228/78755_1 /TAXON_ID=2916 /ORGANISM="Ceratium fusus, Strain PA161109" /LENGTH=129 /DNA_ID=CAMNT_0013546999 /DNA_START=88 /DNA_END=477 /DNA_ORIENTATION=+